MLETICDIMVEAYHRNWITSRDGNVSIRHHDRDHHNHYYPPFFPYLPMGAVGGVGGGQGQSPRN